MTTICPERWTQHAQAPGPSFRKETLTNDAPPNNARQTVLTMGKTYPMDAFFKLGRIYMKQLSNE